MVLNVSACLENAPSVFSRMDNNWRCSGGVHMVLDVSACLETHRVFSHAWTTNEDVVRVLNVSECLETRSRVSTVWIARYSNQA